MTKEDDPATCTTHEVERLKRRALRYEVLGVVLLLSAVLAGGTFASMLLYGHPDPYRWKYVAAVSFGLLFVSVGLFTVADRNSVRTGRPAGRPSEKQA